MGEVFLNWILGVGERSRMILQTDLISKPIFLLLLEVAALLLIFNLYLLACCGNYTKNVELPTQRSVSSPACFHVYLSPKCWQKGALKLVVIGRL